SAVLCTHPAHTVLYTLSLHDALPILVHERARDRHALLLAARELVGQRVHPLREPDEVEHLGHLAADRRLALALHLERVGDVLGRDRKSTRLNSSHRTISYAVFCLKKK